MNSGHLPPGSMRTYLPLTFWSRSRRNALRPFVEKNFNYSNKCQFFRFNVREDFL